MNPVARSDLFAMGKATITNENLSLERRELFKQLLSNQQGLRFDGDRSVGREQGTKEQDARSTPLSFAQERLWFLHQLDPTSLAHNELHWVRLSGALNVRALEASLQEIVRRHDVLRTVFVQSSDGPRQQVIEDLRLEVRLIVLDQQDCDAREGEFQRLLWEEFQYQFQLDKGPLIRPLLVRFAQGEHALVLTVHHICFDAWSISVLVRELCACYETACSGYPAALPPLPMQYADFAEWEYRQITDQFLDTELAFWTERLAGVPTLMLPTDHPRSPAATRSASWKEMVIEPGRVHSLQNIAKTARTTLSNVLLTSFQVILSHYSQQSDFAVGVPVANRNKSGTEALIGFFVNTLVLRADVSGDPSFRELVERVTANALEAYAHQQFPFEKLVQRLQPARDGHHDPLFQVVWAYQNVPNAEMRLPGLVARTGRKIERGVTLFDLECRISEEPDGEVLIQLVYNADAFCASTIERLLQHWSNLLTQIASHPDRNLSAYSLLSDLERHQLLSSWSCGPQPSPAPHTLDLLFTSQAAASPCSIALVHNDIHLSYYELDRRSNMLAHFLRSLGVGPGLSVAICLERGIDQMIAVLGVLKAGACYVPVDPAYPAERVSFLLEDCQAPVLIVSEGLRQSLPTGLMLTVSLESDWEQIQQHSQEEVGSCVDADELAYIIYTSGSTGKPKGVGVSHRSASNLARAQMEVFGIREGTVVMQFASMSFDAAVSEWTTALLTGGRLVMGSGEEMMPGREMIEMMRREGVEVVTLPPSVLGVLPEDELPELRTLVVAGEACPQELVGRWGRSRRMLNAYGPTETTVCATVSGRLEEGSAPLIGKAIRGMRVYVLDERQEVLPRGVGGELCVGGVGVARGYLNKAGQTAEKFVPDAFGEERGGRLYRTGDRARWMQGGELQYLGRRDEQVKVRGYRVELGEVEAVMMQQAGVAQCAVMVREGRLVAYVSGAEGQEVRAVELREEIGRKLPVYMVPGEIVVMGRLPLTRHGKVDRRALPAPQREEGAERRKGASSAVEEIVAGIWGEVLGREEVGVEENFFELGGHSLLATQVISRIRAAFSVELPLRTLFEHATVKGIAREVEEWRQEEGRAIAPPIEAMRREGEIELSYAQQRLWFLNELEPGTATYNCPAAMRLRGEVKVEAVERSLGEIVRRHEVLRTRFIERNGQPFQQIQSVAPVPIAHIDLTGNEKAAAEVMAANWSLPFDLSRGPLLRALLLRLGADDHVLFVTMHHMVSDDNSIEIFIREFTALYEAFCQGHPSPLEELPIQYADFAQWQREWLQGQVFDQQLTYWRQQLEGATALELPTDFPRPAAREHYGASLRFRLSDELTRELKELSRREGVTLFMALLAAFKIVLGRYAGQDDVVISIPIANRRRPELEDLIGFFVNTLLLRTRCNSGSSLREVLGNIRETVLGAYANQDLPYDRLIEELPLLRGTDQNPFLRVMLISQKSPAADIDQPDLLLSAAGTNTLLPLRTDIDLYFSDTTSGISGFFVYNPRLFNSRTIESLSDSLATLLSEMSRNMDTQIARLKFSPPEESPRLTRASRNSKSSPLSYHQERIWFIDKFETGVVYPSSPTYHNIPILIRFDGAIDLHLIEQSLNALIARHDVLRMKVVETDEGLRQVKRLYGILSLQREQATETRDGVSEREWMGKLALSHASVPFKLDRDLPIRASVINAGDDTTILVIVLHHLIADKYSAQILLEELAAIYTAQQTDSEPQLPDTSITYADFSDWQRGLSEHQLATVWHYWRKQLSANLKALELPLDRPRASVHKFSPGWLEAGFDSDDVALVDNAVKSGMSRNSLLLGCFVMLLRKYTGHDEVVIGTSDPYRTDAELEDVPGPVANLLVLRNHVSGNHTAMSILQQTAETLAGARANKLMPFDLLVQKLKPQVDMSRTALFDVLFNYEEAANEHLLFGQTVSAYVDCNLGYGKYDLNVLLRGKADQISATVVYNADIFDKGTVEQMMRHYRTLVRAVCLNHDLALGEIALLSEAEEALQVIEWNQTEITYTGWKTVHELFDEQVARTPDSVAVKCGTLALTYSELNSRANRLAHFLRSRGAGRESLVGVMLDRSADMIVVTLAILKTGAAYMPIDPDYPLERVRFMLGAGRVEHCISCEPHIERLRDVVPNALSLDLNRAEIDSFPSTAPAYVNDPADLAYCIYTSGSTGTPNGVLIQHNNIVRLIMNDPARVKPSAADVWTMFHSYCFDVSVWEMYGALLYGGAVVVVSDEVRKDPALFTRLIIKEGVTVLSQTPSYFYWLVDTLVLRGHSALPVKHVIFAGEALRPALLLPFKQAFPDTKLINMYGITETTVHTTYHEVSEAEMEDSASNVGRPIPTTAIYLLDEMRMPVPTRVTGEMYIGGEGLARGYLNRPDRTAERFCPDNVSRQFGARLYKSGDLARYKADATLDYLGRKDHQVKIRGYRVELGEIEAALEQHQGVKQCAVIMRENNAGEKQLTAYVVAAGEAAPAGAQMRSYLQERLPKYMVPGIFVELAELPLTPNGKLDRRALPAPPEAEAIGRQQARTAVEEILLGIWSDVLGREDFGVEDNFFELGGHSLLATQVVSRMRTAFGLELPLRGLFDNPSVAGLARQVELEQKEGRVQQAPPVTAVSRDMDLPLSFAQQRLWFIHQLDPRNTVYNSPMVIHLCGPLDQLALYNSFSEILRRHEVLRTCFPQHDGEPFQQILESASPPLLIIDLRSCPDRLQLAQQLLKEEAERPFDLESGPVLRLLLLKMGERDHLLSVTIHHIAADGWSVGILVREFSLLYEAMKELKPSPLEELAVQYGDFAVWQRRWLQGEVLEQQLSYWREQLDGIQALDLPTDSPRPAVPTYRGARAEIWLSRELSGELKAVTRREGATVFMTLLAGFQAVLSRYTGQDDIAVGTDVANRNRLETEGLIGFFANQLVLRTKIERRGSFRELIGRVREVTLGAYANQDLPFEKLVEELAPERELSRTPLFDVKLVLQNAPSEPLVIQGLEVEPYSDAYESAKFDLLITLEDREGEIGGVVEYATDLFDRSTIQRLLEHYRRMLELVVAQPDQEIAGLPLLSEAEQQQVLREWNATDSRADSWSSVQGLFEEQAQSKPDSIAVTSGDKAMTYRELNRRANLLASYLRRLGVGPEVRVGLYVERSEQMVAGLMGVLKAGGAYVPLDVKSPVERLAYMLDDAGVSVVLTQGRMKEGLPWHWSQVVDMEEEWGEIEAEHVEAEEEEIGAEVEEDNLAYVIYTSGSTGQPKAVAVTHRGILNLVTALSESVYEDKAASLRVEHECAVGI